MRHSYLGRRRLVRPGHPRECRTHRYAPTALSAAWPLAPTPAVAAQPALACMQANHTVISIIKTNVSIFRQRLSLTTDHRCAQRSSCPVAILSMRHATICTPHMRAPAPGDVGEVASANRRSSMMHRIHHAVRSLELTCTWVSRNHRRQRPVRIVGAPPFVFPASLKPTPLVGTHARPTSPLPAL
jgi:hypothetical protein